MSTRKFVTQVDQRIPDITPNDHQQAVFVLHDQLNTQAWPDWILREKPLLIFIESTAKGHSHSYHKQKLTYVLSAMRHFAIECAESRFPVYYHTTNNHYGAAISNIISEANQLQQLSYMRPSEWDSRKRLRAAREEHPDQITELENGFFFADPDEWKQKIEPGYRMEYFYRDMRRQTGYLMNDEDEPEGGEWNYDDENQESLPKDYTVPKLSTFEPDAITKEVMQLVSENFGDHFGELETFNYAINREQALQLLDEFIDQRLEAFGPYEDAMATGEDKLFHSNLSPYLNNGLLMPWEICERAIEAYHDNNAPINSVEGLVRQILGWREFVHIYYEKMMPEVRETNFMDFDKSLPELFWSGDTKMHCLSESIRPVIERGHSHHIQRLMVLSNFSNLTETDPRALNEWFWFAYVDAYEWVVLPNVLGMSTFADGGVLASKPYVSSGNYINKMSNYCKSCKYSISKKTGKNACPFNYLYWNFVDKQREAFQASGRNSFMVSMYDKKSDEDKQAIADSSRQFLDQLERQEY